MVQNLGLALRTLGEEGLALPPVFARLDKLGAKFRRGQLSLVAAAPGGGKSAFATHYAVHSAYEDSEEVSGVPTLYFSADCDRMTMAKSVLASISGIRTDVAEELIINNPDSVRDTFRQAADHLWFCFDASPGMEDIYQEVDAYTHAVGDYPHLIVVDNLMDVTAGGSEYEKFSDVMGALNYLARSTGAHVMVLCHVTGFYTDGNQPIPRSAIIQKVDKKPRLIITLHRPQEGVMGVRVVKNTTDKAATDASFGVDYAWLPEMAWFGE